MTMPLSRFRDGNMDGAFTKPVVMIGHIRQVGLDVVTIALGRGHYVQLCTQDFIGLLGTPEETLGFFVDAQRHKDEVTIRL